MAWADRRAGSPRWTAYYVDEHGRQRQKAGYVDKRKTEELARRLEDECRQVRDGLVVPGERTRREAAGRALADHVADYRKALAATDVGAKHVATTASAIRRLLASGGVKSLADLDADRVLAGLAAWRDAGRSARTLNHALVAVKAFAGWLAESGRRESPRALAKLGKYDEESDRRKVRRHLTEAEVAALLAAAESGAPVKLSRRGYQYEERWISGPERAALYRLAMGTGFRADEIRTLTPARFALEGDEPTVTVAACYSKNGKLAVQPITRELAAFFRRFLGGRDPDRPAIHVPEKTAKLLRVDLDAAGIAYAAKGEGVVDFHSLRHSYITHLIRSGKNPKVVQALARHSDVKLTLQRYTHLEAGDLRDALEPKEQD